MPSGSLKLGRDYVPINVADSDGRDLYEIKREIDLGGGRLVHKGFVTDFGSVPRQAIDYLKITPREGSLAYVTHDYNYRHKPRARLLADVELLIDQKAEGVGRVERCIVFMALRVKGGKAWRSWAKASHTQ